MKKPATFALARQYGVVLGRAHPVASYSTEKLLSTRPNNGSRIRHHNMLTPSSSSLIATGGKQQPISPATASWPVRFTAATIQAPALFASVRHFSSLTKKRKKINPFKILKVKRQTPYANVKTVFLKIAMQHHPDTSSAKTEAEAAASRDIFIQARQAFEELAEDPETGETCLVSDLPDYEPDEEHSDMDDWFKQQTGHEMPFMDEQTMKEVAKMTTEVGSGMDRGLDRDGGMWELARMVTSAVNSGGDGKNLLKLEAGEVKESTLTPGLRARRKRH